MKNKIVLFPSDLDYGGVPWSLLTITRLLSRKDFDIRIITHIEYPLFKEEIIKECEDALCLGISCITGSPINTALKISKNVKEQYPNLPIIWGGWQAITLPEITISSRYVDYLCTGFGEKTFFEFVEMLRTKKFDRIRKIDGLSYKVKGKIYHNKRTPIEDLNFFPDFDLDLIDWNKYLEVVDCGKKAVRIITSYGCPNRCGFCCETYSSQRHWRGLSAERVIKFLIKLKRKVEFDSLIIGDSNFFVDENRTVKICQGLLKNKFNIKLISVNGTANVLVNYKKTSWQLLKKAGLSSILVGAESGNNITLKTIGKSATVEDTVRLNEICSRYQIKLILSAIVGIPIDEYFVEDKKAVINKEFNELTDLYKKLYESNPGNSFGIFLYTPLPSTPLYDKALKLGFKPPKSLDEWAQYDMLSPHFEWMDKAVIRKFITINSVFFLRGKKVDNFYSSFPFVLKLISKPIISFFNVCFNLRYRLNCYTYSVDIALIQFGIKVFYIINRKFRFINIIDTSRRKLK